MSKSGCWFHSCHLSAVGLGTGQVASAASLGCSLQPDPQFCQVSRLVRGEERKRTRRLKPVATNVSGKRPGSVNENVSGAGTVATTEDQRAMAQCPQAF